MKSIPVFKNHDERDAYFRDNADYYTLVRKSGVGVYERIEYRTLAEALAAGQTKAVISGGGWMIYGVIGEQSAMVATVKPRS
jgi:hypothetical protein